MAGHPELDSISNSMSSPRQSSSKVPEVVHKLTIERHGPATPKHAISATPGGGFKVNDLNPKTQAAHPQGFGTSATKAEALKHLRAIEYFKHGGK